MAENLPLQATYAQTMKIQARVQSAVNEVLATLGFAFPDIDQAERKREVGFELVRMGYRLLEATGGCAGLGDEKRRVEQHSASGDEWDGAVGTPVAGTPLVKVRIADDEESNP